MRDPFGQIFSRRRYARQQLGRLSELPGFPLEKTAEMNALIDALVAPTVTESRPDPLKTIEAFVEHWLEVGSSCPTPRTIRSRIAPVMPVRFAHGCEYCGRTGFEILMRYDGVTGARRCRCKPAPATAAEGDDDD